MRIFWSGVPREVRAAVEPHLKRFQPLIPSWVERLHVCYTTADEDAVAAVTSHEEYRSAKLAIFGRFLELDDDMRRLVLIHEFTHFSQAKMYDVFQTLLDALVDEKDPLYDWADEQWRVAMESGTSDLGYGIARMLGIKVPEDWTAR